MWLQILYLESLGSKRLYLALCTKENEVNHVNRN